MAQVNGAVLVKKFVERVNYYSNNLGTMHCVQKIGPASIGPLPFKSNTMQRTAAGLFDESSFAKARVSGPRAGEFLNYVCANNVVKGVGKTVYTQALNNHAGIESDYTVTQTADNES